jgi:hypothetical protein
MIWYTFWVNFTKDLREFSMFTLYIVLVFFPYHHVGPTLSFYLFFFMIHGYHITITNGLNTLTRETVYVYCVAIRQVLLNSCKMQPTSLVIPMESWIGLIRSKTRLNRPSQTEFSDLLQKNAWVNNTIYNRLSDWRFRSDSADFINHGYTYEI